ncbi:hypothetical protein ACHAXA_001089 [Cyclostephanos tholiformis]|uniref:Uncharacterized protein n=1 Tax=Cyclostephanos tholiformis TaxID=382380 RepID=A0ABD3R322_9STRA
MVLSMAFVDPHTGSRGTYTGQVNSFNHKPDGKGTVYYTNGSVAEGTWENGTLVKSSSQDPASRQGIRSSSSRPPSFRGSSSMEPPGYYETRALFVNHSTGNLDRLDRLNGRRKSRPQQGSASVQSYNSRGSVELPFGSASVQLDQSGGGVVKIGPDGSHSQRNRGSGGPVNAQYHSRGSSYKVSPRKNPEYK